MTISTDARHAATRPGISDRALDILRNGHPPVIVRRCNLGGADAAWARPAVFLVGTHVRGLRLARVVARLGWAVLVHHLTGFREHSGTRRVV